MRTRTHKGIEYTVSDAHPAGELFRWFTEEEMDGLVADITANNGIRYKVRRLPDGRVFDGRNRELACFIAGIAPEYTVEDLTDDEVIAFVKSAHLHRRDMTPSQKALAAYELAQLTGVSQGEGAAAMGASERLTNGASHVVREAPELVEAVRDGKLDVTTATKVAGLDPEIREIVAGSADPKAAAREALEEAFEELESGDGDVPFGVQTYRDDKEHVPPGERHGNSPPEPEPAAPRELGEGVTEEAVAALRTKKLQKWMKPGNNSDPDHPYAELLNALTNLNRVLKKTILNDEAGCLKDNLIEMRHVKLPPFPWLRFTSGRVENGEQVAEPEMRLVWSHLLRSLIRKSGKRRGKMNLANLMKFCRETLEQPVEVMLQEEGEE